MKNTPVAVIIPARYASSRFPGKPLAMLAGKPMIQHVWEKAIASAADVVAVATDDERIAAAVEKFGGKAIMTSPDHPSGTDRIAEAARAFTGVETVINIQGDEPLIPTELVDKLIRLMTSDRTVEMATVAVPADRKKMTENNVKQAMVPATNGISAVQRSPLSVREEWIQAVSFTGASTPTERIYWSVLSSSPPESLKTLKNLNSSAPLKTVSASRS